MFDEKKYMKEYRKNNSGKIKENQKKYYIKNREKILKKSEIYRKDNPDKVKKSLEEWRKKNRKYIKDYNFKNRDKIKIGNKIRNARYSKKNIEKVRKQKERYRKNNIEKIREKANQSFKNKYKKDLKFNLNCKISALMRISLKGNKIGRKWENLVGYTVNDLIKRLRKTMPEGYTWNDFMKGKLHIDHIIPISVWDFDSSEQINFQKCWALSNLQLLSAKENRIKHDKLYKPFQLALKI